MDWEKSLIDIENWVISKVEEAGAKGFVVGMSGGIDSTVVSIIVKRAFPEDVLGLIIPCYSDENDIEDAKMIAEIYNIPIETIVLDSVFDLLKETLKFQGEEDNLAVANLKPRLRMAVLYYFAQQNNYLVAGTGNKSELLTGYFTKYGDGGVDIEPVGHLYKTQIYDLAEYLKVPRNIINKTPSAGLWKGQSDEKEMGITYEDLDNYLQTGIVKEDVKEIIEDMIQKNKHKRFPPPVPEL